MHPWKLAHESVLCERNEAATNVSILRRWVRRNEDNDTGQKALVMTNRWKAANVNFLYGNITKTECSPSSS